MRKMLSWGLYWTGDAVSRLMNLLPDKDGWPEYPIAVLYPVYRRLMTASFSVQGVGDGPWQEANVGGADEV